MKNKKGFTLVELLAVIVLLAIIISITVPAVSKIHTSVNEKQYRNKIKLIEAAALKYADDTNYTSFYVNDLIMNGYLEADKVTKNNKGEKLYLELDNRDNKKVMNCFIIVIQDKNGVLEADVSEEIAEGNEDYEGNAGCAVNIPNSVNEYFDVQIKEFVNGTPVPLTYNKYNGWWTKNKVELTITGKNGNKIDEIEWYEGSSLTPILDSNPNYTLRTTETNSAITNPPKNIIEIGKTVDGVLQQNYTARIKMGDKNYSVTTRVYIDKINPDYYRNNGTAASVSTEWTKSVNYTISAYDNESGVFSYFIDDASTIGTCPDKKENYTLIKKRKRITENGSYYACIIDNVGNVKQSELLEFNNIDNAKLMCNIKATGNEGNAGWFIGGTNKDPVTITVTPKKDGGYSIGPSGIEIGVNNAPKSWPEKNTANSNYKKVNPYIARLCIPEGCYDFPYTGGYLIDVDNLVATTTHSTDTSGTYYYGHIANQAGENKSCGKNIKYEKEIGKPTLTGSTPDYKKITLKFTAGSSQSGLYKAYCSSATETDVEATCDGTTCNCVMKVAATSTATEYTFSIKNVSKAGNESTLTDVKAKNKSACDSKEQYGTCGSCDSYPETDKSKASESVKCGRDSTSTTVTCHDCKYRSTIDNSITCPNADGTGTATFKGTTSWSVGDYMGCTSPCGGGKNSKSKTCKGYGGTTCNDSDCTGTPDVGTKDCGGTTTQGAGSATYRYQYKEKVAGKKLSEINYGSWHNGSTTCKTLYNPRCGHNRTKIQIEKTQPLKSSEAGTDGKIIDCTASVTYSTLTCAKQASCDDPGESVKDGTLSDTGPFCPYSDCPQCSAGDTWSAASGKLDLRNKDQYKVVYSCWDSDQYHSFALSIAFSRCNNTNTTAYHGCYVTGYTGSQVATYAVASNDDIDDSRTAHIGEDNAQESATKWRSIPEAYQTNNVYVYAIVLGQAQPGNEGGVTLESICRGGVAGMGPEAVCEYEIFVRKAPKS